MILAVYGSIICLEMFEAPMDDGNSGCSKNEQHCDESDDALWQKGNI